MKVLLSAYACEPDRGSEPGVGWAWANSLSGQVDVTVVTRANNAEVIEAWYRQHGEQENKPDFIYYDPPEWMLWLKKKRLLPVQLFYILWQLGVVFSLRSRVNDYDVVHHVTFNSMMMPGFWWFIDTPVILGPLGGTSRVSKDYMPLFGRKLWKENLRGFFLHYWPYLPWIRVSFNRAAMILCANSETKCEIDQCYTEKAGLMLETGISEYAMGKNLGSQAGEESILRIVWIGTIEPWKALSLALKGLAIALEESPDGIDVHLDIIGKGSELDAAKVLVRKLGIEDHVTFHGWMAKAEVDSMIAEASALLFTSVKDTSGNVVLEAMAQGLAVVCINHQGVADITTDETAIRIEPGSIDATVRGVAHAMIKLATQPQLSGDMGRAGYQRIKDLYTWEQRAKKMTQIYDSVAG